jgi:maltooligosyltrehalose trehalohydrolase
VRHEIWAPYAEKVVLRLPSADAPMTPDPQRTGWFVVEPERLAHGMRYDILVNGTVVRPDPLARRLPEGVHGPSELWDPSAFAWTDGAWRGRALDRSTVIYELHLGTFSAAGTLAGAVAHLGHLVDLGVTHVELMPVAAFDGAYGWGYDGVALRAVHEAYGGPDALCAFVDAAHSRGLAVLLDVVHNHLGPSGNSWQHFGPFLTDTHSTPWGGAVNLDAPGSDDVRTVLVQSSLEWLRDFHLDGLRLDAVHELKDSRARHFLQELSDAVSDLSGQVERPLTLIAESDRNDAATVMPVVERGAGMSGQWDNDVHHALHWLLTGETAGYYADFGSCQAVAQTLKHAFLHDGRWSTFRGRSHGSPVDWGRVDPAQFVVALQTHDQVGNRARGERLSQLVATDRLAAGAALLLALPYTPMLFMGEEWGASTGWQFFSSFPDPGLGRAVTDGRRGEFAQHGWDAAQIPDPQGADTFARSVLDWSEVSTEPHEALLAWYRDLLRLRRGHRQLTSVDPGSTRGPAVTCRWGEESDGVPRWFEVEQGGWLTVANLSDTELQIDLAGPHELAGSWRDSARVEASGPSRLLVLEPSGSAVLLAPLE